MKAFVSFMTVAFCLSLAASSFAADRVSLWPEQTPHAKDVPDTEKNPAFPTLDLYPAGPAIATGTAVVVCPGGGYENLAMNHEGRQIAEWWNKLGVSAFVLRYRHAPHYAHPVPMLDVQRAIRWVRSNAGQYGISMDRIGVMGFSAGGHLASTAATQFDAGDDAAADPIDQISCRPDFAVLCYPVITMGLHTHGGSKKNLLGADPADELVARMSSEQRVTAQTPPVFLFHTVDDGAVPVENSTLFFQAMRQAKVACEMHLYQHGRHGVGLAQNDPILKSWPDRLRDWVSLNGWLEKAPAKKPAE